MSVLVRRSGARMSVLVAALLLASAGYTFAQFGRGGFFNSQVRPAPKTFPDRNFVVCRLMYTSVRREPSGGGWRTDYPYGEINLTIRFSELTRTPVSWSGGREPNHYVVRLTDDELFQCPFTMASDVGTIGLAQEEADRLRLYLLKGGFLWVDDFWGGLAWEQWTRELNKVCRRRSFHRGCFTERSDLPVAIHRAESAANHQHPVLARDRRQGDVRARRETTMPISERSATAIIGSWS